MQPQAKHQEWTGISYVVGDHVHIMPFDEFDTEHDVHNHGDCHCGPESSTVWPFSNSATPAPPQTVWHHKPTKEV